MEAAVVTVDEVLRETKVSHVLRIIERNIAAVAADAITINQIPAPTFSESERAGFLAERFASLDLEVVRTSGPDVIASFAGTGSGPSALLQASLDSAFPESVNPTARVDGKKVVGPGIGDNSLGLASLLALAELVARAGFPDLGPIHFAATAESKGAGNVGGMRRVVKQLKGRVDYALCLRGHGLGRLSHSSVRTQRYRIRWDGNGTPIDPLELLPDLLRELGALEESRSDVSFDLDPLDEILMTGAHATDGLGVDVKLGPKGSLAPAARRLRGLVREIAESRSLPLEIEEIGGWKAASIEPDHPLVTTVEAVQRGLNVPTLRRAAGPEGAVALQAGIPTVVLGITHGRNRYREDEWVELEPISKGLAQVTLTLLAHARATAGDEPDADPPPTA